MRLFQLVGGAAILIFAFSALLSAQAFARWEENGTVVCADPKIQSSPRIVSDAAGGAIIVWEDLRSETGPDRDLYAQVVDGSGNMLWTVDGEAVCASTSDQRDPQIASDGAGGAVITWRDNQGSDWQIYAQHIDSSGVVRWGANGVAVCAAYGDQYDPQIASDGAQGAIITWRDLRSPTWQIYAQHVDSSGAVQWGTNGYRICPTSATQYDPRIISYGIGEAVITWEDHRRGDRDIFAQRLNTLGVVQWTAAGAAVCTSGADQFDPQIALDGTDGVIITWYGYPGASHQIYAQRLDASGTALWSAGGEAVCTAARNQMFPQITSDGTGGAVITWNDDRSSFDLDIYAQRVDASGTMLWAADGEAICTAAEKQDYPQLTADGTGGAVITWEDHRNGDPDIFAQRIDASGTIQWLGDGVAICTELDYQVTPQIVTDGTGGAIITWYDLRDGGFDIYAHRIEHDGSFVSVGESVVSAKSTVLCQNCPNPFNPTTQINFTVARPGLTVLRIFDTAGRQVRTLVDGWRHAKIYDVIWDGRDDEGREVVSGVYFYELETPGYAETRKMVLLR